MLAQLLDPIGFVAMVIVVYVSVWFVIALVYKRNDVADIAWGFGFAVAAIAGLIRTGNHSFTAVLVTLMVLVWGLRLGWHIGVRNSKKPEDYRYKAKRDLWGTWFAVRSYVEIFLVQGLFMLLVVSPVLLIDTYADRIALPWLVAGTLLWIFGFVFESVGDKQLKNFIAQPENKGHIMTQGLWKYTRHPNYFGEVTQWWAISIIALPHAYGWLGILGPAVITFLITKVSGIPLLEARYADNAEYQAYKLRTRALVPFPVKK